MANSISKELVYVDDSAIHGKGLFAKTHIAAGDVIGIACGEHTDKDGPHVLWINDQTGFHVQCNMRFINHSDEPNACYYDTLEVCAIRDIAPGEEITHNYEGTAS
ncbi:MAG: SET domain-containing protein [Thioalkalispiraceae bacterium]|jgi:SET domain-containing protein